MVELKDEKNYTVQRVNPRTSNIEILMFLGEVDEIPDGWKLIPQDGIMNNPK